MRLRDLKCDGVGIIETMNNIKPLTLFDVEGLESKDVDGLLYLKYGNRRVTTSIRNLVTPLTHESLNALAKLLVHNYYPKWERLITLYIQDLTPTDYELTTTETVEQVEKGQDERSDRTIDERLEQVTGYNSDEFTDTTKHLDDHRIDSTTTRDDERNTQRQRKVHGVRQNKINLLSDGVDYLQKYFINDIIHTDILHIVTLSIDY